MLTDIKMMDFDDLVELVPVFIQFLSGEELHPFHLKNGCVD